MKCILISKKVLSGMISSDECILTRRKFLSGMHFNGGLCFLNFKFHKAPQIHQKEGDP